MNFRKLLVISVLIIFGSALAKSADEEPEEFKDAASQYALGVVYLLGQGVPKDERRALSLFTKAAAQGDANAQWSIGALYSDGKGGLIVDDAQAVAWYRLAAAQGHSGGQHSLGMAYFFGKGAPKDEQQAASWFRKAADKGDTFSQRRLGAMYSLGRGVPKDDQLAYFWLLLASAKGDAGAAKFRDQLEPRLTPEQRAAAQADARNWKQQ